MKSLVKFINEALIQERFSKADAIEIEVNGKDLEINTDELIQALSKAHSDIPTGDVMIVSWDYEDPEAPDENCFYEWGGIKNGVIQLNWKDRTGFVNKDIYDTIIKDLDAADKKTLEIDTDGMAYETASVKVSYDDKNDFIVIELVSDK